MSYPIIHITRHEPLVRFTINFTQPILNSEVEKATEILLQTLGVVPQRVLFHDRVHTLSCETTVEAFESIRALMMQEDHRTTTIDSSMGDVTVMSVGFEKMVGFASKEVPEPVRPEQVLTFNTTSSEQDISSPESKSRIQQHQSEVQATPRKPTSVLRIGPE